MVLRGLAPPLSDLTEERVIGEELHRCRTR